MRVLLLSLTASVAAIAAADAGQLQSCTRGGDVRTVEVVTPGVVGAACDLKYVRENGANISVPYHADFSASFCDERAQALIQSLVSAGFSCVVAHEAAPPLREVKAEPAPAQDPNAAPTVVAMEELATDATPSEPDTFPEPAEEYASDVTGAGDVAISAAAPLAPPESTSDVATLDQPAVAGETELAGTSAPAGGDLSAPEPVVASRGPTALSPTLAAAPAPRSTPTSSVVGRLVGASPDARPIAQTTAVVGEERLAPVATPSAPVSADEPQQVEEQTFAANNVATAAAGGRPAPDIIRSVLMAQAAAWNEGDLEAFMGGYWKSPDVRFVSGTDVSKGWNQTLKRYRDRYSDGPLGRLSFDGLDIQMVTADVAVVVGRFNLARDERTETGAFTLVMKRFDGLWRIVHDHSVGESPAATQ